MNSLRALLFTSTTSLILTMSAHSQVLMSGGAYSQNFNSFASSGTANAWADNSTLLGWYAQSTNLTTPVTADYRAVDGASATGDLYSYGSTSSSDRALGSIASGSSGTIGYGLRIANDTGNVFTNLVLSYVGEQWRNGGNASAQTLGFSYRISGSAISGPDVPGAFSWTSFSALSFTTPITGATFAALDGNLAVNQLNLSGTFTGVVLNPGEEIFFRWIDLNDAGNDHGFAIDDLSFSASVVVVPEPSSVALSAAGGFAFLFALRRRR